MCSSAARASAPLFAALRAITASRPSPARLCAQSSCFASASASASAPAPASASAAAAAVNAARFPAISSLRNWRNIFSARSPASARVASVPMVPVCCSRPVCIALACASDDPAHESAHESTRKVTRTCTRESSRKSMVAARTPIMSHLRKQRRDIPRAPPR